VGDGFASSGKLGAPACGADARAVVALQARPCATAVLSAKSPRRCQVLEISDQESGRRARCGTFPLRR